MSVIPKVSINFAKLKDDPAITQVEVTASIFEKNPGLLDEWPAGVTNPIEAKAIGAELRLARTEASKGGKDRTEHRKAIRAELDRAFCGVVHQIETMAIKDPKIIPDAGLVEQKSRGRGTGGDPEEPVVTLSYGIHPGLILVSAHRLLGASAYQIGFTYADPMVEANLQLGATLPRSTHIPVENLQQGSRVYIRMRGLWPTGFGPWSAPVSIIVL